jgi:hypothetical protein
VFREIQIFIDDALVGTVWNYPLVFTGGVNPFFWRPIVGIGAFNYPTYTVDLDPFIGNLMDGNNHSISLAVKGIIDGGDWIVSGGLHLWLDPAMDMSAGSLTEFDVRIVHELVIFCTVLSYLIC